MTESYKKLKNILAESFMVKLPAEGWKKNFYKDLGFNSLEFVEMVVYVENSFGISFSDPELEEITTVKQMTQCIDKYLIS